MFLQRTMEMLASCPKDVACWNAEGTAFMVKQVQTMERRILPLYFKHNNFASFTRQLRFYGFEKSKEQVGANVVWEFSHPKFLRDSPGKIDTIRRKTCTDTTPKWNLEEVSELQSSLSTLQNQVTALLAHVSTLTTAVCGIAEVESKEETKTQAKRKTISLEWDAALWDDFECLAEDWSGGIEYTVPSEVFSL
ncbi:hypothetical protein Ae201684P_005033 [Aphanomyces euteiches]|nr:hypothetical protein Ae201684P_005033 [Aphanomyces euteiches]KAH9154755.1 hypothetical protein AeRB84_003198 [Aphanomyces euteiches]